MRKITELSAEAFLNGQPFKMDNTIVKSNGHTVELFLFGNKIATSVGGTLSITNAGWKSNTTKERLNALPGVSIQQVKRKWFLNGQQWDGRPVEIKH